MKWKQPPLIKIYEALGSIGDKRIELKDNTAKIYSSSGNKYYDVIYDPDKNAISSNDNGSYWVGYLGYPSIAFLLIKGIVDYNAELAEYLKGFAWKDINQKFKNNFTKTQNFIDEEIITKHKINLDEFHKTLENILDKVSSLELNKLPTNNKPPTAY
ncbi:MAG: hypothetical protein Q8P54_01305 [bacterium]|nr:hypothetical protein [bacterium]